MIITCGKCDTSYELNEDLVKAKGSKVRCKNCSHVFTVYPPSVLSSIEPEPELELESVSGEPEPDMGPGARLDSLGMSDLEKMLESQSLLGPDSIKITGVEPELSLSDLDEKPASQQIDFSDDLDFLDLSDIEKMLDKEVAQGEDSVRITGQEPELSLEMEPADTGDSLDLDDIERMLDAEAVKGPDSVRITDQEPELTLSLESGPEVAGKGSSSGEDTLDLPDLASLLEIEEPGDPEENQVSEDEMELSLGTLDDVESLDLPREKQEESLELDLDLDEELRFDDELDEELKLEMEGDDTSELKLEMDTGDESDLELELETDADSDLDLELDLDLDLDELKESGMEPEKTEAVETRAEYVKTSGAKSLDELIFELDLDEPEEKEKTEDKPEKTVAKSKEKVKPDAFAMGKDSKKLFKREPAFPQTVGRKSHALTYILAVLLIVFGGAFGYLKYTGQDMMELPFLVSLIPEKGEVLVVESSLKNEFIDNVKAGTLLVITGHVENKFNKERKHIMVSVEILGIDKTVIKTDRVYCGNILKNQNLVNDDLATLKRFQMKPDGVAGANLGVKPGALVPFMAVFSDLPGSVKEFRVKVAGSEPANP
jgi:predicted Zn finger-like uncharacterized protein